MHLFVCQYNKTIGISSPDGTPAKLLRDDTRGLTRSKERQVMVQDEYETGKVVLRQRGIHKTTKNSQTAASVMSSRSNNKKSSMSKG